MKSAIPRQFFPALLLAWLVAWPAGHAQAATPAQSAVSKAASARVTPALQQALAAKKLKLGEPVFIRIFKQSRELEVWVRQAGGPRYALFKTYPICAYSGQLGPKQRVGDNQAPEGFYRVAAAQMNP